MKNAYSRFAISLALVGVLSGLLIACNKHTEPVVPAVANETLTANIKAALSADPELKGVNLNVEAHEGVVKLSGELATFPLIDHALSVARAVTGVKTVEDKITKKEAALPVAK